MGEVRESSVIVSLSHLMALEKQRVLEEQIAAQQRAEAEANARAEAERRAREAALARAREEEERRRLEEARAREEEVRIEALRQAAITRARIEAEHRVRLEAALREQEHERALRQIAADAGKRRLQRLLAGVAAGGALVIGAALGIYLGMIRPEVEQQQLALTADLAAREEAMRALEDKLERTRAEIAALEAMPKPAPVEANPEKPEPVAIVARPVTPRRDTPIRPDPVKPRCNPGDPMCSEF